MNPEPAGSSPDKKEYKLWLTGNDYIRVDAAGYVLDRSREGAFGIVIPLWKRGKSRPRALKLPRLIGDTLDENARTCKMLEDELTNALTATGSTVPEGLAKPSSDLIDVLKGIRSYRSADVPKEQHELHVILASFEKGRPPRFCAVQHSQVFDISTLTVFPPSVKDALIKTVSSQSKWEALAQGRDRAFEIPAYCQSASESFDGTLDKALRPRNLGIVWYAGLPALVYDWSESTLQEAIDAGIIKLWPATELIGLFATLLAGLVTLHKTILHGDLRPANVMCLDDDKGKPTRYVLIDFGSFVSATSRVAGQADHTDNTVLAARMVRNRISVFYSPERRQPFEVEGVTMALITRHASGQTVILGRESMLSSPTPSAPAVSDSSPIKADILSHVNSLSLSQGSPQLPGVAVKDDLLRVQEKLFTILEEKEVPESLRADVDRILLCDERVARVFNERIAVLVEDQVSEPPSVVSVSGYTIIPKMSVADDLYSFGSICLYVLLSKAFQEVPPKAETVQAATNRAFIALMSTLDNVSYATAFWRNLESLRPEIEALLEHRDKLNAEQAPTVFGFNDDGSIVTVGHEAGPRKDNLFDRSKQATDEILQNVPYGQQIYSALGKNTVTFVMWMHFVICCLHRADTVLQTELAASPLNTPALDDKDALSTNGMDSRGLKRSGSHEDEVRPFCTSRAEGIGENGPAARALNRIRVIEDVIGQSTEPGITVDFKYDSVATFKPRSELHMRIELDESERQIDDLKKQLDAQKHQIEDPKFLAKALWRQI